ncbi:MAG: MFS transporter [Synergistaceae bacterium]|jgi:MFS family permease|nr:MFS transporter [Synergistaceae bacterium]
MTFERLPNTSTIQNRETFALSAIYVVLAASYFLACLLRSSSSVVLPKIAENTLFAAGSVGFVSSLYFYGYAMVQPFAGQICDVKGPARTCAIGMILLSSGVIIFGMSESILGLSIGRLLMGIGAGPTFCGIMVHQAKSFSPGNYPKLTGISMALGHIGGIAAIYPMRWGMNHLGQFRLHALIGGLAFAAAVFLFSFKKSREEVSKTKWAEIGRGRGFSPLYGFKLVASNTQLRKIMFLWCCEMTWLMTLVGLWGIKWMTDSLAMTGDAAASSMSLASLGVLVGSLCAGAFGHRLVHFKHSLKFSGLLFSGAQILFVAAVYLHFGKIITYMVSLILGGLAGFINVMCNAFVHKTVGKTQVGAAIGVINTMVFCSVLGSQWVSGIIIERANMNGYMFVFILIAVLNLLAAFILKNDL